MDVVFGTSSKGKQTVIYCNFEYVEERENHSDRNYFMTLLRVSHIRQITLVR